MNEFKIDDTFFKDEIDYKNLDESIYTQFAKTMAKNVDIDLAKTPLVDILTGYTRYRILQSKIDKAIEFIKESNTYYEITHYIPEDEKQFKINMETLTNHLLDILKEDK